jgi:hypothetical protein
VQSAARAHGGFIAGETLAVSVTIGDPSVCDGFEHVRETDIDGVPVRIALRAAAAAG